MRLITTLIDLYSIVVLVAVVMSWIGLDRRQPAAAFVYNLTEPVLTPIRNALPPVGGLDFSPMVLLIALRLLRNLF
ncbi:MAG TPA: YggT family protein [Vicinamibacterales bacterium]|jgi:YggT family protein|nr:YggT family protein [Vicinamibacterales bacterium]